MPKEKIYKPDKVCTNKKHPCKDCDYCQICSDSRCELCLREQKKLPVSPDNKKNKITKKYAK